MHILGTANIMHLRYIYLAKCCSLIKQDFSRYIAIAQLKNIIFKSSVCQGGGCISEHQEQSSWPHLLMQYALYEPQSYRVNVNHRIPKSWHQSHAPLGNKQNKKNPINFLKMI